MSGFLLDTNIPSETIRARPDRGVADWVRAQDEQTLFLSVVTVGELLRGFTILEPGARRSRLEQWFEADLLPWFDQRILPVTKRVAERWGVLDGICKLRGTPVTTADGLIAATALEHGLTVVTRNVRDFAPFGIPILNPWKTG